MILCLMKPLPPGSTRPATLFPHSTLFLSRLAREKGRLTTPYVFCEDDASAMAEAGADIVVCHLGLTTGGSIGAETALKLEDCPAKVDAWAAAALKVNPDIIVLVHGGPVSMPEDATYVLKNTKTCHGF